MEQQQYGSATAQDLYHTFIRSGAFDQYPHWGLIDDDDDDPVGNDWYVIVDLGNSGYAIDRRRLDAARLWMAILACASNQINSVTLNVAQKCRQIVDRTPIDRVKLTIADADVVMQVALLGQVDY